MPIFAEIAKEFQNKFSVSEMFKIFLETIENPKIKAWIKFTITVRLFKHGIDKNYEKLITDAKHNLNTYYADYTYLVKTRTFVPKRKKPNWNNKTSNVTLHDFGDFYQSFNLFVNPNSFAIDAYFWKKNEDNGKSSHIFENFKKMYSDLEEFEDAIAGLTEDEMIKFLYEITFNDFINNLKKL